MGNVIANRDMEKVFAADDYSVVGIAGTAGIAIELVRLYQVELEHYEKIEGAIMSLEGKANRLASMIRGNLGLAMQGLTVVPTYAGFDLESATGRIYSYDVTGGCYVEGGHHSTGSGSVFARGALKKLWRPGPRGAAGRVGRHRGALRRRRRRLGHRGPRPRPPDLADRRGRRPLRRAVRRAGRPRGARASASSRPVATTREVPDEHAVLRPARAGHEGPGRLRAQGNRARTVGRRGRLRPRHRLRRREPVARPAQGVRDLRPHRLRGGRALQRVREPAGRGHPLRRPARLLLRPHRRHGPGAGQHVCPDARGRVHPGVQALRDRDRRGRGRAPTATPTRSSG